MDKLSVFRSVAEEDEQSPACKRARYDLDHIINPSCDSWTLSCNEVNLHSIYDSGVRRLICDSELSHSPISKSEQIAVLEASLSENTLQKLSLNELDNLLITNESRCHRNNTNRNYFDTLSDEVILQIWRNLKKSELRSISLTCRRFRQLAEDESLWTKMDISRRTLEVGAMGTIMSRQVIILKLAEARILSPPILENCKASNYDFLSRLMYLDLTMTEVSSECLELVFDKCRRLKKLSLESLSLSDQVLIALSRNRDLEVLNLAMATGVELEGLNYLLRGCRKLRELNMSWTYLSVESIKYICNNLPITLNRFNFSGCRKLLHDDDVTRLVINCPHLRELDLSDCTSITEETVRKVTILDELNFLALSRCYLVPYRSILRLKRMKSLAYLDIHGTYINADEFRVIKDGLGDSVNINKFMFSSIARPTVGHNRSSIWNMRVRD